MKQAPTTARQQKSQKEIDMSKKIASALLAAAVALTATAPADVAALPKAQT